MERRKGLAWLGGGGGYDWIEGLGGGDLLGGGGGWSFFFFFFSFNFLGFLGGSGGERWARARWVGVGCWGVW